MARKRSKKRTKRAPKKKTRPDWAPVFLMHFATCGNITLACREVGICRNTFYVRRDSDPDFARALRDASREATEVLEAEAWRRAHDGVDEPVYYQGVECGAARRYSDTLLIFLLKARNPRKYRERLDVKHRGTVRHQHGLDLSKLSDAELDQFETLLSIADPGRGARGEVPP